MSSSPSPTLPGYPDTQQVLNLVGELEERLHRLKTWQHEHEAAFTQLAAATRELDARRLALELLSARLQHRRARLAHMRQAVGTHRRNLAERLQRITRQETELAQQQRQLDALAQSLAQRQTELDHRATELQSQLSQLDARRAELDARAADLAQTRADLQAQQDQLDARRAQLDQQLAELAQTRTDLARQQQSAPDPQQLARTQQTLDAQDAKLKSRAAELDARAAAMAQRDTIINQRQAELERKLAQYQDTVKRAAEQLTAERQWLQLRERNAEERAAQALAKLKDYESRLPTPGTTLETSPALSTKPGPSGPDSPVPANPPDTAPVIPARLLAKLKAAEAEILARRQKLHRYKAVLRDRSAALKQAEDRTASARQQYEGLLQQRQTLLEVKQFLADSEAEMVHRWATYKAGSLAILGLLTLAVLGVFSYLVGQAVVQPTWRATCTIETATAQQQQEGLQQWILARRDTLLSQAVLAETLNQLGQRGARPFDTAGQLKDFLQTNLTVASTDGRQLNLELHAVAYDQIVLILESLARAYVGYQLALDRQAGKPAAAKIIAAAARASDPVSDARLPVSAGIFTSSLILALLTALVARWWLGKTPHVMQAPLPAPVQALENADHWPPPQRPSRRGKPDDFFSDLAE